MKRSFIFSLIVFVVSIFFSSLIIFSQTPYWECEDFVPTSTYPFTTSSDISLGVGINGFSFSAGCTNNNLNVSGCDAIDAVTAMSNGDYIEFGVTANSGYTFSVGAGSVDFKKSNTGPTNVYVYSDQDGYTTPIATISTNTSCTNFTFSPSFKNRTSIIYRFVPFGASNTIGQLNIDNIILYNWSVTPIELLSFNGVQEGNQINLEFSTLTESDNSGIYIEKSIDGYTFKKITFLYSEANNGNSSEILEYQFIDKNPYIGVSYYRLRQIDLNGKETILKTIGVRYISSAVINYDLLPEKCLLYGIYGQFIGGKSDYLPKGVYFLFDPQNEVMIRVIKTQ